MTCASSPSGLIPWFSKLREILTLLCCITLSSSREKSTQCSRGSKKDFWCHCRGVYAQVKTYQVPITNSSPSHYIICHLPLVFLSPLHPCRFIRPLFLFASFSLASCLLVLPCAFYLLASLLAKNLLIWIHLKCCTWIIFDPYALVLKPQLA